MSELPTPSAPEQLGGRLPLLHPDELSPLAAQLYPRLLELVTTESTEAGYRAVLSDGRLLGPFNSMLYAPALTSGLAEWTAQIGASGLDPHVREAIILTIGGRWRAPFEIYAHTASALAAGMDSETITRLIEGTTADSDSPGVDLATILTLAVLDDRAVPDSLFRELVDHFGVEGTIACLHLIGQYQLISSLLVTFQVPTPD